MTRFYLPHGSFEVNMSDVRDVNEAHQRPENTTEAAYMRAARKMLSPTAGMADRMAFMNLHNAGNVVKLANIIDALRDENRQLMEMIYGVDSPDEE